MRLRRTTCGAALLCVSLALAGPAHTDEPAPARRAIPFKQDQHGADTLAYQSIAGLLLAALAAYGAVLGLKRFGGLRVGPLNAKRRLRSVESMRLGRRGVLHVVHFHDEELLLAEGEHGLQLVRVRPLADGAEPGAGDA